MASSELVSMQNATAKAEMAKADAKTNNSEVTSDMFLKLMLNIRIGLLQTFGITMEDYIVK